MKLKPKMLLSIGIPLIVIFILMGTIIYLMASSGLKSAVEVGMEQRAGRYAAELDGSVQEKRAMVETIAQDWSVGLPQGDDLQQAVLDISARPGVFEFYVGFPDGSSVVKDQASEGFDPRTRPWYKNAVNSKNVELSEVYQTDPDKTRVITLSKAVYNKNGELVAVIGMDASVDSMTEILKDVKVGEHGSLFVLGPDSEFIYHKKFTLDDPRLNEMDGGKYKDLAARGAAVRGVRIGDADALCDSCHQPRCSRAFGRHHLLFPHGHDFADRDPVRDDEFHRQGGSYAQIARERSRRRDRSAADELESDGHDAPKDGRGHLEGQRAGARVLRGADGKLDADGECVAVSGRSRC